MTDSADQPLLEDVRRWLSLAVENLSFGVALAEVGSERVLYANAYARNVWRLIARDEAAVMSYVGFRPDGTRYRPEEWPLRRALRSGETVADEEIAVEFPEGGRGVVVLSAAPIHDDRGTVAGAVVTMYDVSEYRRAETALALLAEVSEVLTESERDYEVMLRRLTQLVVPRMADWCAIDLWQDGEIRNVGVAHIDPEKVALAHDLQRRLPPDPDAPRGVGNVLRTGRSELMAEIPEELIDAASPDPELQQLLRDLGLHSAIVAPLIAHGEVLGALTLISAEQRRTYTADDV